MRIVIAARLSQQVHDRDQHGLDSQEREVIRWAEQRGHEVVAVAADFKSGRSGLEARANLRPWVTEPNKIAMYDALVAWKVDRLTRGDRSETSKLEAWAHEHGKQLLIASADVRFPSEGTDGISWDLMLRIAHEEWLATSERYRRMHRTLKDKGSLVGRPPYGYKVVKRDGVKTLEPDPTEAQVIKDAADWYLAGVLSLDDICDKLNAAGRLPRPKRDGKQPRWVAKTLAGLLKNETLAGRRTDAGGRTLLRVEPVLSRAVWQAVQDRMATRAKRRGVAQSTSRAMLTSIIRCAAHGRNMYVNGSTVKGYSCRVKGCGLFLPVEQADAAVDAMMRDDDRRDFTEVLVPADDHADEIVEVRRDMREALDADDFDALAALRVELERLKALPSSPARVERVLAEQSLGEVWRDLPDDNARRGFLLERRARVAVGDGEFVLMIAETD